MEQRLPTPYFLIKEEQLAADYELLQRSLEKAWNNYIIGYSFKTNSLPWLISFVKKEARMQRLCLMMNIYWQNI